MPLSDATADTDPSSLACAVTATSRTTKLALEIRPFNIIKLMGSSSDASREDG